MAVESVWGRIQGHPATLESHEGSTWAFQVPPWAVSPLVVEIWAEDDVGNVSYRTGIFQLEDGTVKCIRWREEGSSLVMLADARPRLDDVPGQCSVSEATGLSDAAMAEGRSSAWMVPHACSRLIEVIL